MNIVCAVTLLVSFGYLSCAAVWHVSWIKKNQEDILSWLANIAFFIFGRESWASRIVTVHFLEEISYGYKLFIQEGCDQELRLSMMVSKVKKKMCI